MSAEPSSARGVGRHNITMSASLRMSEASNTKPSLPSITFLYTNSERFFSKNGIRPCWIDNIFALSFSTQITLLPSSAIQAAVVSPTNPAPITATLSIFESKPTITYLELFYRQLPRTYLWFLLSPCT